MAYNVFTSIIVALSFGVLFVSIVGFFGGKHWVASLFSHFRFHYCMLALLFLGILLLGQPFWWWLPLLSVLLNGFFLKNKKADGIHIDLQKDVRIMSANLFIANFKYEKIAASILSSKADVVILYEIFEDTFQELKKRLPEYSRTFFEQSPMNLGIAVFARRPELIIHTEHFSHAKIATVVAQYPLQEKTLRIVGYHTDAPMTKQKYAAMKREIAGLANLAENVLSPLVVLGDFNDTTVSPIFQPLFKAGLKDGRKSFQRAVSWPLFLPQIFRLTLDHVLVKNGAHVVKRDFGKRTGSDHEPVVVEVAVE